MPFAPFIFAALLIWRSSRRVVRRGLGAAIAVALTAALVCPLPSIHAARPAERPPPATQSDDILAGLAAQIRLGAYSREHQDELVRMALDHQADAERPWVPGWGAIIEAARDRGQLSDERWLQYLFNSISVTTAGSDPAARLCDLFMVDINRAPDRTSGNKVKWPAGFHVALYSESTMRVGGVEQPMYYLDRLLNGTPAPDDDDKLLPITLLDTSPREQPAQTAFVHLSNKELAGLKEGPQEVKIKFHLRAVWDDKAIKIGALPPERIFTLTTYFKLVAPPRVVKDPKLAAQIKQRITIRKATTPPGHGWVTIQLFCYEPPADLAFEVSAVYQGTQGGKPIRTTLPFKVYFPAHQQIGADPGVAYFSLGADYPGAPVDIVLTPSPAASPVGTEEIWGGEIKFENVAVEPEKP